MGSGPVLSSARPYQHFSGNDELEDIRHFRFCSHARADNRSLQLRESVAALRSPTSTWSRATIRRVLLDECLVRGAEQRDRTELQHLGERGVTSVSVSFDSASRFRVHGPSGSRVVVEFEPGSSTWLSSDQRAWASSTCHGAYSSFSRRR